MMIPSFQEERIKKKAKQMLSL